MCTKSHRHSIFCILPPHILRKIASNAPEANERDNAQKTLAIDTTQRLMRATIQLTGTSGRSSLVTATTPIKQRSIYTANNTEVQPGTLVRGEGQPVTQDKAVDEAYDGLGSTFDFFESVYERNSIDDEGLPLIATVHFGDKYDNAFFDGQQMVFGDGDGQYFNRFTISLDVIGHELTHGVTGDEAGLIYLGQSGALNESVSDVFGSLIKQFVLKQTADQADWLIGAELFTSRVNGVALRSMKAPGTAYDDPILGKDPQPANMKDYVVTQEDQGGVHINSGIPNHAFYLLAIELGGFAWETAGRIWYETLRDPRLRKKPSASFKQFARLTALNAERLYDKAKKQAVIDAWKQVGVSFKA
jgi:Zn-dependent metalloprotease